MADGDAALPAHPSSSDNAPPMRRVVNIDRESFRCIIRRGDNRTVIMDENNVRRNYTNTEQFRNFSALGALAVRSVELESANQTVPQRNAAISEEEEEDDVLSPRVLTDEERAVYERLTEEHFDAMGQHCCDDDDDAYFDGLDRIVSDIENGAITSHEQLRSRFADAMARGIRAVRYSHAQAPPP